MARVAAESCGPEPDSERARAGHLRQPRNLANEMSVGGKLGLMTDRLGEYLEPIYSMASVMKFHLQIKSFALQGKEYGISAPTRQSLVNI